MDWSNLLSKAASIPNFLSEKLVEKLFSRAEYEISLIRDLEDEIGKLQRTHERIHAVLTDSEERRYIDDDSVKRWLLELKDLDFVVDELLDRYQTQLKLSSLDQGSGAAGPSRKRKRSWSLLSLGLGHDLVLLQRWRLATQIAKINERFEEIAKARKNLRLEAGDGRGRGRTNESSLLSQSVAFYESCHAIGREGEKAEIVGALTLDHGIAVPVLPIHGAPGVGKTTVAQLVYDDAQVKNYFALRIWVGLSKGFDVKKVTKEIIEAIDDGKKCDIPNLDALQRHLADMVSGRKFLLVLDNLWAESFQFWETLRLPLVAGGKESKVLITTRSEVVWRGMPTLHPIHLKGLNVHDCSKLLLDRAFPHGCSREHPNLEEISKRIAERCQGTPLAAKLLGCLLYNVTEEDVWEDMLNEVCLLEEDINGILPSLMISYNHLNYNLKRCLKYCCMFPNCYEFDRDELVRLWMAEGLIQRSGNSTLEMIGSKYFDNLLWRSFFEVSGNQGQKQKYRMPSLIHGLARLVSKPESLVVEHDVSCDKPEWVRYASLFHQNEQETVAFDKLYRFEKLQTFKLYGEFRVRVKQVPEDLFLKLTCLRVLDLSFSEIEELPDSVGDLIHLRYLGLYRTEIQRLPESVCWLYNLQTLELGECYRLRELPKGTSYMVNLRHLGLHVDWERDAHSLTSMPQRIGKLTSLQTLSRFIVTSENGCNIGELKDLNLRGELCISKLENVVDVMDAQEANLSGKQIDHLKLQWSNIINPTGQQRESDCERVIACLHPNIKLKYLWIENYAGRYLPVWLENRSFSYLETLKLSCCRNCEQLPLIGQLPRLRNLWIKGMHGMRSMGNLVGFQSLEKLILSNMPNLERLFDVEGGELPRLRELSILHCPELKELTVLLPVLVKLELRDCQKLPLHPESPSLHDVIVT